MVVQALSLELSRDTEWVDLHKERYSCFYWEGRRERKRKGGEKGRRDNRRKERSEGGRRNTRRPTWNIKKIMNLITLMVLVVKNPPANAGNAGDAGLIPRSGRSPGEGHGDPLQYSCLKDPVGRGAWRATVHRVAKNPTQLKRLSTHTAKRNGNRTHDGAQGPTFSKEGANNERFNEVT